MYTDHGFLGFVPPTTLWEQASHLLDSRILSRSAFACQILLLLCNALARAHSYTTPFRHNLPLSTKTPTSCSLFCWPKCPRISVCLVEAILTLLHWSAQFACGITMAPVHQCCRIIPSVLATDRFSRSGRWRRLPTKERRLVEIKWRRRWLEQKNEIVGCRHIDLSVAVGRGQFGSA